MTESERKRERGDRERESERERSEMGRRSERKRNTSLRILRGVIAFFRTGASRCNLQGRKEIKVEDKTSGVET